MAPRPRRPFHPTAAACLALLLTAGSPAAAQYEPPPVADAGGELVNYETPLIAPLLVTADGEHLVAINEPDGRVVVRRAEPGGGIVAEVRAGQGLVALAERPGGGEIWASAMHSSAVVVIATDGWRVTHTLRPAAGVEAGLRHAAAPGGIAFSSDGGRAFVAATATDAVNVYDAETKAHLFTRLLEFEHNGGTTRVKEPRAVARAGDSIYVAAFRSGNNTAAPPHAVMGISPVVLDLDAMPGLSLPDADLIELDAADGSVLGHQKRVGGLLFGLRVHPASGELLVTHMDGRNADFLGEGAFPRGRVARNTLTVVPPGGAPEEYTRVPLEDLDAGDGPFQLAMPTDIAVDGDGRIYVAAYASAAIGVFDATGALLGRLPTDRGPRGLVVTPDGDTLHALNRIDGTITSYDVSAALPAEPLATVPIGGHDPTWEHVAAGRALYNDAAIGSGADSTGCFSCHPDLGSDGLGWDLSAYHDPGSGYTPGNPPRFWRDRKFVRTTQDARSLQGTAPYHWRGEQHDLEGFNDAFVGLQHGRRLSDEEFAELKAFVLHTFYPANPFQPFDRGLSPEAETGWEVVSRRGCQECHTLPVATRGSITAVNVVAKQTPGGDALRTAEPATWLGLWTKDAAPANLAESGPELMASVTGFGFDHGGSHANLKHFVSQTGPRGDGEEDRALGHGPLGALDPNELEGLYRFLHELDSGLAPCANVAQLVNAAAPLDALSYDLLDEVDAGHCDLAASGRLDLGDTSRHVGLVYDRDNRHFVPDDSQLAPLGLPELARMIFRGDATLLLQGVPLGSGERVGVDRDRDGLYDGDERRLGTEPGNPDSDGDGFWDSYDDDPLTPDDAVSHTAAPVISGVEVVYVNARTALVRWETDTFSPSRAVYGLTPDYGQTVGDPLPLPSDSNRWKRRHALTLRNLENASEYHFQVEAQAQNGEISTSADFTVTTLAKVIPTLPHTDESIQVEDLELELLDGAAASVAATVTLRSNLGEPIPDATVRGVWTVTRDGDVLSQTAARAAATDAAGIAVVPSADLALLPGDTVDFTVPMYLDAVTPGVLDDPETRRPFSWSDNEVSSASLVVP